MFLQISLMCGHLDRRDVGARGRMKREECIPGGARLEDLAHGAGADSLLEGAYCIAHWEYGDGDSGPASVTARAGREGRTAERGLEKGLEVFVLRRSRKKANACGSCSRS